MIAPASSILLAALLAVLSCAAGTPEGPLFALDGRPADGRARVYVYRRDTSLRGGCVRVQVGANRAAHLLDAEFASFELDPGTHEVALMLHTAWGLPQGWNRVRLDVAAGDSVYLRVWADFEEIAGGPAERGGDFAAPGRADRHASLGVFAAIRSAAEAMPEIQACRRSGAVADSSASR